MDSGCVPRAMYDAPRKDFRAKKKTGFTGDHSMLINPCNNPCHRLAKLLPKVQIDPFYADFHHIHFVVVAQCEVGRWRWPNFFFYRLICISDPPFHFRFTLASRLVTVVCKTTCSGRVKDDHAPTLQVATWLECAYLQLSLSEKRQTDPINRNRYSLFRLATVTNSIISTRFEVNLRRGPCQELLPQHSGH